MKNESIIPAKKKRKEENKGKPQNLPNGWSATKSNSSSITFFKLWINVF
jgi:hypothetical protein